MYNNGKQQKMGKLLDHLRCFKRFDEGNERWGSSQTIWGDQVVWYALLFVIGFLVALFLLLSSRHLVTYKRWYDFSFMLGMAFLLWGFSGLLALNPDFWYQLSSSFATILDQIFLLLALRSYPLPPHLYYDRWKNGIDLLLLAILYFSAEFAIWKSPHPGEMLILLSHFQPSIYILGTCLTVLRTSWQLDFYRTNKWLLFGCALFILLDASGTLLPGAIMFPLGLVTFAIILLNHWRMGTMSDKTLLSDDSRYLYQKFTFNIRDERIHWLYLFGTIIGMFALNSPNPLYMNGMLGFIGLLLVRSFVTRQQNKHTLSELFAISSNLENQFAQNLEQLKDQNKALTRLLTFKQQYEHLLQMSNEQNVKPINYENLYAMIEEFVEKWHSVLDEIRYVRVAFESAEYDVYYEVERGESPRQESQIEAIRLTVDEKEDSPQKPRFIVVEVSGHYSENGDVLIQLLAIHTCRLVQRCMQAQQALEIRLREQEMALASRIQSSLIPKERLSLDSVQAKVVYIPMDYVGGDYVDYVVIDERYNCFLIADISGHGVPASLLTTGIRSLFRAVLETCLSPDAILTRLNRLLYDDLSRTRSYVTMFIAVLDQQDGVLRISRAGHPSPIYLSKTKQMVLPCKRGIGLGLSDDAVYECDEIKVEEDFILLMYTDGLMDLSRGKEPNGIDFWLRRLRRVMDQHGEYHDRIDMMEQMICDETKQGEQNDDVTVLILEVTASGLGERGDICIEAVRSMSE